MGAAEATGTADLLRRNRLYYEPVPLRASRLIAVFGEARRHYTLVPW